MNDLGTGGEPAGGSDDDERKRLELEKLRLDVAQASKGDFRATLASFAPIVLGLGTLFVGIAGLLLNETVSSAAKQQQAFANYTQLTEEFAKGGTARLGAVVGFRAFLRPPTDRTEQTVRLLAGELLKETDPQARRAIADDLIYTGIPAFGPVRDANIVTREKLRQAAVGLIFDQYHPQTTPGVDPDTTAELAQRVADEVKGAADRYDPEVGEDAQRTLEEELAELIDVDASTAAVNNEAVARSGRSDFLSHPQTPSHWVAQYSAQVPAFLTSVDILRALLNGRGTARRNLDASGIAVFGVDLTDADLEGIRLENSALFGVANGADLTNADLSGAWLSIDLHRSSARSTTLCGARLGDATLELPTTIVKTTVVVDREALPNLTAANWWDLDGTIIAETREPAASSTNVFQSAFPPDEPLAGSPADEKKQRCAEKPYTQHGSVGPDT